MKKALMQFADNAGPDQPALMRRLIRAFVARLQNQMCSICRQRLLRSNCKDKHAHLGRCLHMTYGPFYHDAHHMVSNHSTATDMRKYQVAFFSSYFSLKIYIVGTH